MEVFDVRKFKELTSMNTIDNFIHDNHMAFLYFSRPGCSVCHGLLPQIQAVMEKYPSIQTAHINVEEVVEVTGRFSIFTVPVMLLFVEGKEYVREARIVHIDLFEKKINRIYQNMLG